MIGGRDRWERRLEGLRRELELKAAECDDCRRLEGELARERDRFSSVRSKIGDLYASLEAR